MQFVHAYFLCICEEYELLLPFPSDEWKSKAWFASSMQTARHILDTYAHGAFGNNADCFDWFAPGEQNMLELYHLLKQYNFKSLAGDILGKVYNESFIEQSNRSEKGQFYTPPHIVEYMLDTLDIPAIHSINETGNDGYKKCLAFLNKTVADLACGSGAFLLVAAARKRSILQHLVAAGEINQQDALDILTRTIVGFDSNPFACYLAAINLLIQCLSFLLDRDGQQSKRVAQLRVYCADALDPHSIEQANLDARAFDYLIGNPPYVSAHESSSNLLYRNKIWNSGQYQLLTQKWDLFVPFFERNLQLLQPETGRLGLIVSSGIETEGYAQRLRQTFCERYNLLQIDFLPGLHVFPRTGIESTMVFLENHLPIVSHNVVRRRHLRANLASIETLPPAQQSAGEEQVFRWRYQSALAISMANGSIPLCAIAYIGTGIEAQSNEHAEQVIDGQRHKRFTLYDVFTLPSTGDGRPAGFLDDGVLGDDVDNYHLRRKRYVAYEHYRPYMRGPRHPALFRTPEKLLLGETSGGYYDTSGLFTNHSVQVVVPWHALAQKGMLQETGIRRVLRKSQQISGETALAQISQQFDLRYILAIINSRFIRRYIAANMHQGTRKGRIYPDIWKQLPIKIVPPEQQKEIALLVEAVQNEYTNLADLGEMKNKSELVKVTELMDELERLIEEIYTKA
ncbi:MAG TPA: N-6 DNA methylase [Ktedonobacteraceae bacterium]|nr:N-6 DNA methylase [Ktedonobacteraceae bacterium]